MTRPTKLNAKRVQPIYDYVAMGLISLGTLGGNLGGLSLVQSTGCRHR